LAVSLRPHCVQRQLLGESSEVHEASNWFTHPFHKQTLSTLTVHLRRTINCSPSLAVRKKGSDIWSHVYRIFGYTHYSPIIWTSVPVCLYAAVCSNRPADTRQTLTNEGGVKVTMSVNWACFAPLKKTWKWI